MERASGILMPISCLPSPYGIGTFGKAAYEFVDFLKASGQRYWQLLPLNPIDSAGSPYSSVSTFAGNAYYIDPDILISEGFVTKSFVDSLDWGDDKSRVDYAKINIASESMLRQAFETGKQICLEQVNLFRYENPWVENYAFYMALKKSFDSKSWQDWPDEDIRMRRPEAMKFYSEKCADEIEYYVFVQYLFFEQWKALKEYGNKRGIKFIGDIPIYVALDSADVWSEPQWFRLDEKGHPLLVSGCPPDPFAEDGQLWGNPLYDYQKMQWDGFGWWIRRVGGAEKLYDVIRIDHFRGFESYWAVPAGDKTAINGHWEKGPGMNLVGVLTSWFRNLRFIAEDLGFITPEVKQLLSDSGLPGMKLLQFAFTEEEANDAAPYMCPVNSIYYIGTHDNDTALGWVKTYHPGAVKKAAEYMNVKNEEDWLDTMIRTAMGTPSFLYVMTMQDALGLGSEARMNVPGVPTGNWTWRMLPGANDKALAVKILTYTKLYGRYANLTLEDEQAIAMKKAREEAERKAKEKAKKTEKPV